MSSLGVVLLHGKWDHPEGALAPLAKALQEAGLRVSSPRCTWSPRRLYDCSFDQALAEAETETVKLRESGCERVILGGHSLGANAALACAARGATVEGLLLLAPGHLPDRLWEAGETRDALARSTAAQPGRRIRLPDFNQGRRRQLRIDPSVWLSFFDPSGSAVMRQEAPRLGSSCPVLWISARQESGPTPGRDYAFDLLPPNAQNAFLEIDCGHAAAPAKSISTVLGWIGELRTKRWTR